MPKEHYDRERCEEYKEWPISKSKVTIIILAVLGFIALLNPFLSLFIGFIIGLVILFSWPGIRGSPRFTYVGNARQRAQGKKEGDDAVVHNHLCDISKRYCRGETARQIAKDYGVSIASVKRGIETAKKEDIIRYGRKQKSFERAVKDESEGKLNNPKSKSQTQLFLEEAIKNEEERKRRKSGG